MKATLRFKLRAPDAPGNPSDTAVVIKVEVGELEQDLRDLILAHVAPDIHKQRPFSELSSLQQPRPAETISLNRWSEEPMDVCHGEWTEAGISARGVWTDADTFVPDLITAEEATLDGLVNAIIEDDAVLYGEDANSPEMPEEVPEGLETDEGEEWKNG